MNVDIRKEQYKAYRRDHTMAETQKKILHHVSRAPGGPPATTQPASYARWSKDSSRYPWVDLERSLYRPSTTAEDEDEEADDDEADGDEDEESSQSQDEEDSEHSQDEE